MTNQLQFEITNFFTGTERQQQVGILGTFKLHVRDSGGTLMLRLSDLMLCKSREGKHYIESPSREYTNQAGEKKKARFISFWPEPENRHLQEPLIEMALAEYNSGGSKPRANTGRPSQPQAQNTSSSSNEPW